MNNKNLIDFETKKKWFKGWSQMMVKIWQDRLMKYRVYRTGALYGSVKKKNTYIKPGTGDIVKITHAFLTYGIYVDMGTGREFGGPRNELGQLLSETGRKRKPWLSSPHYRSVMVAKEFAAEAYGDEFVAMISTTARDIAKRHSKRV